jgi:predicted TIM-barrel fold metal-dependent hydrolase
VGTGWGTYRNEWIDSVEMARQHPNVYLETATSIVGAGLIEFAVRELGAERLVFGTDSPLLDPAVQKAKITGADIENAQRDAILGGNMRRILRL